MGVSKEAYTYIKRNLKALNTFDNNNNSGTLDALTKDFLIFEKEFVVLTIMNRWLAGLFKKIGEKITFTPENGFPTPDNCSDHIYPVVTYG
jgi:hypothetical protein